MRPITWIDGFATQGDATTRGQKARPRLVSIEVDFDRTHAAAELVLEYEGSEVLGSAESPVRDPFEAAALATAVALAGCTGMVVDVTGVKTVWVSGHRVCTTLVSVPSLGVVAAGSVAVDEVSPFDAGAKSLLHAVNRLLTSPDDGLAPVDDRSVSAVSTRLPEA